MASTWNSTWRSAIWSRSTSSPTTCQPTLQWSRECKADIWCFFQKKKKQITKSTLKKVNNKKQRGARPNQFEFEIENKKQAAVCLWAQWGRLWNASVLGPSYLSVRLLNIVFHFFTSVISMWVVKVEPLWWTWRAISKSNMICNFENCAELQYLQIGKVELSWVALTRTTLLLAGERSPSQIRWETAASTPRACASAAPTPCLSHPP